MRAPYGTAVIKQAIDLGYVLRQFPDLDFGMDDFDHRMRIQKFVYLLQTFDIYLGYDYSWYLRGPYCTQLATIAYTLSRSHDSIPIDQEMVFTNPDVQERFEEFKKFVRGRENNNDFLEIAASLHMLRKAYDDIDRDVIVARVAAKRDHFDRAMCEAVWGELERWNLM